MTKLNSVYKQSSCKEDLIKHFQPYWSCTQMKLKRSGAFCQFFIEEFKKRQQQRHKGSNVLVKRRRKFLRTFSSHTFTTFSNLFCLQHFFFQFLLLRFGALSNSLSRNEFARKLLQNLQLMMKKCLNTSYVCSRLPICIQAPIDAV